ncbi:helix-turn-helix domain-containing protein [Comamonas odontotermitis]|uniref:helix-turn-helix domain-containing protein n=1 Tax=Comamonas odontotermitis TaxID=379895 RepID=UPI00366D4FBA
MSYQVKPEPPPIPQVTPHPTSSLEGLSGLGSRLSLAILHLAISQSEFARRLGSSPAFISDTVRGLKKPGAEFLASIKQTFGISIDWLLTGHGTMFGISGINLDLLRTIRLYVAVARAAIAQDNPTAKPHPIPSSIWERISATQQETTTNCWCPAASSSC